MPANDPDQKISRLYRDLLNDEVRRPEVRREKKAFLQAHFEVPPFWFLRPAFFVPAFLALAATVMFQWQRPFNAVSEARPPVHVLRAASHEGPVMIYQKTYQDAPVTIIWVFPAGGH